MNYKVKTGTYLVIPVLIIVLGGCEKTEYGPELTENAEITEVVYTPSQHGSGNSLGVSANGTVVTSFASIDIPEVFAVVFKCEHGKFIVKRKDVWEKAKTGMAVTVHYREVYKVLGEERRLIKYDFLGFKDNVEVYAERSAHP